MVLALAALVLLATAEPRVLGGQQVCATLAGQTPTAPAPAWLSYPSDDTGRLQAALDACAAGQVVALGRPADFGPGVFFSGPLRIPASVTLQLAAGVELYASSPDSQTAMIEAAPSAAIEGPGVIAVQPASAPSDLIRSHGNLQLRDLTLRAAPQITVHHLTDEPLGLDGVSIVSMHQALLIDSPDAQVSAMNTTLAGSDQLPLPESTRFSSSYRYSPSPCRLETASTCLPVKLPPVVSHLELSADQVLAAIFTPAELTTAAPAGTVDFALDGVILGSAPILQYAAWLPVPVLSPGPHTFSAATHDDTIRPNDLHVLTPRPSLQSHSTTTLSTALARFPFGTSTVLAIAVSPSSATGSVTLTDSAQPVSTLVLSSGQASFTSNSFAPGTHNLVAAYAGDASNAPSASPPLTLIVDRDSTTLQLSALPATAAYGSLSPLAVSVSPLAATGSISLHDLASPGSAIAQIPISNGVAIFPLTTLALGSHTLSATYAGDTNDSPSSSFSATVLISLIPTAIALSPVPGSAIYGSSVTLNAQLSPPGATGTVSFSDSVAGSFAQVPAASNTSAVVRNLPAGPHSLLAGYSGDATHAAATSASQSINITPTPTSTALSALPANPTSGSLLTLTSSVLPAAATGVIQFRDATSGILGSAQLKSGTATLATSTLLTGSHTLSASYLGDANDQPSISSSQTVLIALHATDLHFSPFAATANFGAPVTLTVTTVPSTASGNILFSDGATVLGSAILVSGSASLALPRLAPGAHSLAAAYGGDAYNGAATTPALNLEIVPDATVTSLTLAGDPTQAGTPLVVNIAVSAPVSSPTGTVILRSGSATLASGILSSSSQGKGFVTLTVPTSGLSPGKYPLAALYLGDLDNSPSDTLAANQSFTIVPTPVAGGISLSANPVPAGLPVTVIAALSSSSVPTGSVIFFANGSPLPAVSLDGAGRASATLPALAPGSWVVSATYTPSAPFSASVLAPLILNVELPYSITVNPDALTLAPGASGSSLLTLTPAAGFSGRVQITCLPAATYIHCNSSVPAVNLGGNSPATVTVAIAVGATIISRNRIPAPVTFLAALAPVILLRRRRTRHLICAALLSLSLYTTGCGAGYFDTIVPGPYKVNVIASVPGFSASQLITVNIP